MASKFWVGGTGNWTNVNTANWSLASGGATGAAVPTAADDVFFDANSGTGTVTMTVSSPARSLQSAGSTVTTFVQNSGIILSLGDATAGASSKALDLSGFTTYTAVGTSTSNINFVSTSATQQTINTNNYSTAGLTFTGVGSSYILASNNTTSSTAVVTHSNGTLDTGNFACNWGSFSSNVATARTLTLGSSAITITAAGSSWNTSTITNLTITANTAVVTFTGGNVSFSSSTLNLNGTSLVYSGTGNFTLPNSGLTMANLTYNGPAVATGILNINANYTITNEFKVLGQSTTFRVSVASNIAGTTRTVTAAVSNAHTNVDWMDIAGAGAAIPFTGTSMGDGLGNSNITFDASQTLYRVGSGGSWSSSQWSLTSGGATGARIPLPQDDVFINASASGTIAGNMPRGGRNIDWTGFAGTWSNNVSVTYYGNMTVSSTMSVSNNTMTLAGRGSQTLTNNGKAYPQGVTITAPGGTYTLQDAMTITSANFLVSAGNFDHNGFNVSTGTYTGTTTATVTITGTTVSVSSPTNTTPWTIGAGTTFVSTGSTVAITGATGVTRQFAGGGKTYNIVTYNVANSPGTLNITGANTIGTFNVGSGRTITFPSSVTNTVTNWSGSGANNGYQFLPGLTGVVATTPNNTGLAITGDIDIRLKLALLDWTPAAAGYIAAKGSASRSWDWSIGTTGLFALGISTTGTATTRLNSTAVPPLTDGTTYWIRATWNDTTDIVNYYYASGAIANPVTADWTQIGANVSLVSAGVNSTTEDLVLGAWADKATQPIANAKYYRAQIRNNVLDNGTGIVYDADFSAKTFGANSFTESSTNAATVSILLDAGQAGDGRLTINSSVSGTAATMSSPNLVSGDYLVVKDSTAAGSTPFYAGANGILVSGTTNWTASAPPAGGAVASNLLTMGIG